MKLSTKPYPNPKAGWWISGLAILFFFMGCKKWHEPPAVVVTTIATGLTNPMGIEMDAYGNLWVGEGETINNDGSIWFIKPNGKKYKAIVNLSAFPNKLSNEPQGTAHLLLDRGYLWVLSGDFLYHIDVSHFLPGDKPINAAKLAKEDIGAFVYGKGYDDSHPYNLTMGPNGDIFIADAGANAIIHRKKEGKYAILAEIPGFSNPNPAGPPPGPPYIQSVPTSIWYDGQNFLVTTLTGFPFLPNKASIFEVSRSGKVSLFRDGFTTLVDLAPGRLDNHLAVHYGDFGPTGFIPNSGSLIWTDGSSMAPFVQGLDLPVGIRQYDNHTWFVTCTGNPTVRGSGTVKKVSYR